MQTLTLNSTPTLIIQAQDYIFNSQIPTDLDGEEIPIEQETFLEDSNDLRQDFNDLQVEVQVSPENEKEEKMFTEEPQLSGEVVLETEDDSVERKFDLTLPSIPGAECQDELEVEGDDELEVEDNEVEIDSDPWKWKTVEEFLPSLETRMKNVPTHTGKDTSGIERAIAYLRALDSDISKAVRMDIRGVLDVGLIEDARRQIHDGIKRSEERLEKLQSSVYGKKKKKANAQLVDDQGFVKEARAANFQVNVSLFMSALGRLIINSTVSAGHDMEVSFKKLADKFKLTDREKFELVQLLQDMGYPLRRDRGILIGEDFDPTSSDNFDMAANYQS